MNTMLAPVVWVFKIGIQGRSAIRVAHTIVGDRPVLCARGVWWGMRSESGCLATMGRLL